MTDIRWGIIDGIEGMADKSGAACPTGGIRARGGRYHMVTHEISYTGPLTGRQDQKSVRVRARRKRSEMP